MHSSLGPHESTPKQHLDRFSRFRRARSRDQHTDTDRSRTAVAVGRIYAQYLSIVINISASV